MAIITGQVFKPDRVLYYLVPTKEEKDDFYHGIIPESLLSYHGSFGCYNAPELYKIKQDDKVLEIIGIEFRPNDSQVDYPTELPSLFLTGGFMVSLIFADEEYLDDTRIEYGIEYAKSLEQYEFMTCVRVQDEPELIQISSFQNRNRVLLKAQAVTRDRFFTEVVSESENPKIYNAIYRDSITGHYNWGYIWPRIAGFGLLGIQDFAFVHFDVKSFNAINIMYGHDVANRVLIRIANLMKKQDWIYESARCDNDNFAMMIKDMPEEETRAKLQAFFDELSNLDVDRNYRIYYRCGVVPMRNTLQLAERVADAGKQVQRLGEKYFETEINFYTDQMHDTMDWAIRVKAYLDTAIANDEFLVYLQPKYDIRTEKLYGAEALVRWKYRGEKLLSPKYFVPVLEAGGLIGKLDDIVLKKVCENLTRWKEEGKTLYPISVNLSRKRFVNPNLVEHLTRIVDSYQVDHALIDFELTESAAYENQEYMIGVIRDLKNHGFHISMDDFGTGYSSLALLAVMPMDTIKIDKSFIDGIGLVEEDAKNCSVLKNIIALAKELKFTCIAEGAEEKTQVDILREFGCEVVQGYYYSKPVPVSEYEKRLEVSEG